MLTPKKPIAVTPENLPLIAAFLDSVNGKATAWTLTAEDIFDNVQAAELELSMLLQSNKPLAKAALLVCSGGKVAKAYKYRRTGTDAYLVRNTKCWMLQGARRSTLEPGSGTRRQLFLTAEQDARAVAVLRKNYRLLPVKAEPAPTEVL